MTAATIGLLAIIVGAVLIVCGVVGARRADRIIDEILAAEQRQIERESSRAKHAANLGARWQG